MKYFAYGSNMDPERMKKRDINFLQREHATLKCYTLKFNKLASRNPKEGYANIFPDRTGVVEGVLYNISDSDIATLDRYEGYPDHYDRINVMVQLDDVHEVEAIAYIAQANKVREGLKPSRDYLNYLLAAKDILSEPYYRRLESLETLE